MTTYTSISELKRDFGFQSDDITELKSSLKELIKEIHPDKNNGQFKNKLDELNYQKILSALDYLNQDFAIVPKSELTALTAILKDNFPDKKEEAQVKNLEDRIDRTIKSFRESNLFPKVSSTAVAAVLTFLWLFPSTVKDHPVLSKYISPSNFTFTAFWFYSVFTTGSFWLFTKRNEERIKDATKKLNLESVQNKLFESFIKFSLQEEENGREGFLTFSKDELIEYFINLDIFTLEFKPNRRGMNNPMIALLFFTSRNRNVDLELAQSLTDIIIERAKRKNLIKLEQDNNLSDTYKYKIPEYKSGFRRERNGD